MNSAATAGRADTTYFRKLKVTARRADDKMVAAVRALTAERKRAKAARRVPAERSLVSACSLWVDAGNAWEEMAACALELRLRDSAFRRHSFQQCAEDLAEDYAGLLAIHKVLRKLKTPRVKAYLRRTPTLLSAVQEVIALGAPDLAPRLRRIAEKGRYSTRGFDRKHQAVTEPPPGVHAAAVLQAIENCGRNGFERTPGSFFLQDEEQLRDNILLSLTNAFPGASGETFSNCGKTDILVKIGHEIVFIAECKIWRGEKGYHKALNQLIDDYLTWRDGDAAIILFVKHERNFNQVLEKIERAAPKHPYFVETLAVERNHGRFEHLFQSARNNHVRVKTVAFNVWHDPAKPLGRGRKPRRSS